MTEKKVNVIFRLTPKERAQFRIWCIQQGSTVQETLAAFAKSKIRRSK